MSRALLVGVFVCLTSRAAAADDLPDCAAARERGRTCTLTFVDCVLAIGPEARPPPIPVRRDFIDRIVRSLEDL